jgi:hypothetical protein
MEELRCGQEAKTREAAPQPFSPKVKKSFRDCPPRCAAYSGFAAELLQGETCLGIFQQAANGCVFSQVPLVSNEGHGKLTPG